MNKRLNHIYRKARENKRRIVLPEGHDPRVVKAAGLITKHKLAEPILLDPEDHQEHTATVAAEMVKDGRADGFVAGASFTTRDVARAALRHIGVDEGIGIMSSAFLMLLKDKRFGEDGVMVFSDCGILPNPTAEQLAKIAICSADIFNRLMDVEPKVAMLSYSTCGSGKGEAVDKVSKATDLVRQQKPDLLVEGEIQADAALIPEIAKIKCPDGNIGAGANILIFPDLDSGNIAYKLVQRLAGAQAIGPLLQGLNKPCSDLSRGCSVDEIVDTVAITAVRA